MPWQLYSNNSLVESVDEAHHAVGANLCGLASQKGPMVLSATHKLVGIARTAGYCFFGKIVDTAVGIRVSPSHGGRGHQLSVLGLDGGVVATALGQADDKQ
jgi:hypothetical protein